MLRLATLRRLSALLLLPLLAQLLGMSMAMGGPARADALWAEVCSADPSGSPHALLIAGAPDDGKTVAHSHHCLWCSGGVGPVSQQPPAFAAFAPLPQRLAAPPEVRIAGRRTETPGSPRGPPARV